MKSPNISLYDYNKLIQLIKEKVPFYTPEWRFTPEYPDAGTALFMIFARMFEETVNRYNQVLDKNYIAFLNLLNAQMDAACSSRGYITFTLSPGAPDGVMIRKGKQVFSQASEDSEGVVFETQENLYAIPAELKEIYNVSMQQDVISITSFPEMNSNKIGGRGIKFFDFNGENNQEHKLYIANDFVFDIKNKAVIELAFVNSVSYYGEAAINKNMCDTSNLQWSYFSGEEWISFDEVYYQNGRVVLKKENCRSIDNVEVDEALSRWICCRVKKINAVSSMIFDGLKVSSSLKKDSFGNGILPERMFCNELEANGSCIYPFGERFMQYNSFYIGSDEVLSKAGAEISIDLAIDLQPFDQEITLPEKEIKWKLIIDKKEAKQPEKHDIRIARVTWEYWNGLGWVRLPVNEDSDTAFCTDTETKVKISFKRPEDLCENYVNSIAGYWIRVMVTSVENPFAVPGYYLSPRIKSIYLDYEYSYGLSYPTGCKALNNMEFKSFDMVLPGGGGTAVKPFCSLDSKKPGVYIGFDKPLEGSPIRLLFMLKSMSEADMPALSWEYLREDGGKTEWKPLKVIDDTDYFKYSGILTLVGAKNFKLERLFGKELYWIRALNTDERYDSEMDSLHLPEVTGVYVNSIDIVQQETMDEERFSIENGEQNKEYALSGIPVLSEEVWVNEFGSLSEYELQSLKDINEYNIREIKDSSGIVQEIWVKWKRTDDVLLSDYEDRHYYIDVHEGFVRFGDGIHGKIPTAQEEESISICYATGGGKRGNLNIGAIDNIGTPVAFIDSVFNPVPTYGGCDRQDVESAVYNASQLIKHQNRAVAADDYENLARKSSSNVLKAKCVPGINKNGKRESKDITVVIVPSTYEMGQQYSRELRKQVQTYLTERMPCGLEAVVMEPVYIKIAVVAEVKATDINIIMDVENSCKEAINSFINPIHGNYDGRGWEIGEIPHVSKFYSLLKGVPGVYHIEKIILYAEKLENDVLSEIDINDAANIPHAVAISGVHKVNVDGAI